MRRVRYGLTHRTSRPRTQRSHGSGRTSCAHPTTGAGYGSVQSAHPMATGASPGGRPDSRAASVPTGSRCYSTTPPATGRRSQWPNTGATNRCVCASMTRTFCAPPRPRTSPGPSRVGARSARGLGRATSALACNVLATSAPPSHTVGMRVATGEPPAVANRSPTPPCSKLRHTQHTRRSPARAIGRGYFAYSGRGWSCQRNVGGSAARLGSITSPRVRRCASRSASRASRR